MDRTGGVKMMYSELIGMVLEMDHINTTVEGDQTVYTFKTTALAPDLAKLKANLLSMLDLPVDIPQRIEVQEVKKGPIFKEYLIKIYVTREWPGAIKKINSILSKIK